MAANIMGGIPDNTPITQRMIVLKKPIEKSLAKTARNKETGAAMIIATNTTRKVPHIAGNSPYCPFSGLNAVEKRPQPAVEIASRLFNMRFTIMANKTTRGINANIKVPIFIPDRGVFLFGLIITLCIFPSIGLDKWQVTGIGD
jgi:hypothetical protein